MIELARPADEREQCTLLEVHPEARARVDGLPYAYRLGLAFRDNRFPLLVVDDVAGGAEGRLGDQDAVDRRCRLQPSSGVDDVTRCHALPFRWSSAPGGARPRIPRRT